MKRREGVLVLPLYRPEGDGGGLSTKELVGRW
jgi:hypothetical protein